MKKYWYMDRVDERTSFEDRMEPEELEFLTIKERNDLNTIREFRDNLHQINKNLYIPT